MATLSQWRSVFRTLIQTPSRTLVVRTCVRETRICAPMPTAEAPYPAREDDLRSETCIPSRPESPRHSDSTGGFAAVRPHSGMSRRVMRRASPLVQQRTAYRSQSPPSTVPEATRFRAIPHVPTLRNTRKTKRATWAGRTVKPAVQGHWSERRTDSRYQRRRLIERSFRPGEAHARADSVRRAWEVSCFAELLEVPRHTKVTTSMSQNKSPIR